MGEGVELRGLVPRSLVDVIDAIAIARRQTRMEVVVEVLGRFVAERVHEATLIQRVQRGNPHGPEAGGGQREGEN